MSTRRRRDRKKRRRDEGRRARARRRVAATAGLGAAAALGIAAPAEADVDTITVTSLADPGDGDCATNGCTLREAITESDDGDTTDVDQIVFQSGLSGTITLDGTQLPTIDEPLTIEGPGADTLTVSGAGTSGILHIDIPDLIPLPAREVTVSGLTLRGGAGIEFDDGGGGAPIRRGGAIASSGANLAVQDAAILANGANRGGGISSGGQTTIENSTISGNGASGGCCSPSGRQFLGSAGGLATVGDTHIRSSTISGNSASVTGGVSHDDGTMTVEDSTISQNSSEYVAGGISAGGSSSATLTNTIVAGNSLEVVGEGGPDLFGDFDLAFSLIGSTSGATVSETVPGSNILGVDPQLGPLQDNGGPTQTQLPAATSPAVDQGMAAPGETEDQRGEPRPFDLPTIANSSATGANGADIGAVELTAAEAVLRCADVPATIIATDETTTGTPGRDVIYGRPGPETIRGGEGKDLICAREGDDTVLGGDGKDKLRGAKGEDTVKGGKGADGLRGGPGPDQLFGGKGGDSLLGGHGNDSLFGGPGPDHLAGGKGEDREHQ